MKLGGCWGWEGRRSDASPPMEKGRGAARSFCMIYLVKLGQVTLVPLGTQLCRGSWERDHEQGSSPVAPPLTASPEPAFSNNQKSCFFFSNCMLEMFPFPTVKMTLHLSSALTLSHPFSCF